MTVTVKINDEKYRYDIYQIISLFFSFQDIAFVEEDYEYNIYVLQDKVTCSASGKFMEFPITRSESVKEQLKKAVYNFFSELTGKVFPWGTLIGIRPSKIALTLLREGCGEKEIIDYYKERYLTSEDKARLCIDVARYEEKVVNRDKDTVSIYIGMPFCPTRCSYCSFASNPISACSKLVEPYLEALKKEIVQIAEYIESKNLNIESVYFGGGTPTSIDDVEFHGLMDTIYNNFVLGKSLKEFTVECGRPDSITISKLQTMKNFRVNRISVNPQTMNDTTLKRIGRNHSVADVVDKFKLARELGFDNINMDIIVGLPGEGLEEMQRTCGGILNLLPDSITVHGMSIKRASKLHEDALTGSGHSAVNEKELSDMYELTRKLASGLSMKPYYMYRQKNMAGNMENVGYSKPGKEGLYNIQMIEEKQTIIALGADGVSKVVFLEENRIERFANVKNVSDYVSRIDEMVEKKIELLEQLY